MKVTLQQIEKGNEEIIIRYRRMTERLERIVEYLEGQNEKLSGTKDGQQFFINIQDILYLESVEGVTYFYTKKEVYRVQQVDDAQHLPDRAVEKYAGKAH